MKNPPSPKRWQKVRVEPLASTRIFEVTKTIYRHPERDRDQDFVVINPPDWVNVVALTVDRQLVLVRQFRFGINDFSLEIPGGMMDPGEDPIEAGLRELREETGFEGKSARLLGSVHPNPAIQSNLCHLVLVEEACASADLEWDPDEEIEITTKPVDEVYQLAYQGAITHALVLNALLLFAPHWQAVRSRSV